MPDPKKKKKKVIKPAAKQAAAKKRVPVAKKTVKKAAKRTAKTVKASKVSAAAAAVKNSSLEVYDLKAKSVDTIQLDPIFQGEGVNSDVIYQTVLMYRAGEREGTASTKERGAVRGGGKKPWKQKGTGQARHGSRRSPIWRGGGVTFGPMPRDYSYSLPQQLKRKAVIEGVKDKVENKRFFVVSNLTLDKPKTRLVADILEAFKLEKPLFLVDQRTNNLTLASRNIRQVAIKTADEVNILDVASHKECLITKAAYAGLVKRLKS